MGRHRGSELGSSPYQAMISNDPLNKESPLPRQSATNSCPKSSSLTKNKKIISNKNLVYGGGSESVPSVQTRWPALGQGIS